jgi:hypothetical protein
MRSIRLDTLIAAPIGGVTTGVMRLGDSVTWRARHFGVVFRMTSAITEYQPPSRFVDEQRGGGRRPGT